MEINVRGCPQGSNFGPLLWNVFHNDRVYDTDKSGIKMYVDDHEMYFCGETMEERTLTDEGREISS